MRQRRKPRAAPAHLEVVFRLDPTIGDGEYANNGWLQEAPKPITRLTWDNAVMISPGTAQQLGLATGDYVQPARCQAVKRRRVFLSCRGMRTTRRPCIWVMAGAGRGEWEPGRVSMRTR